MIDALDHVHLYVDDVPAAAAWYRRILGFHPDPAFRQWFEEVGPYVISCAAASLSLFPRRGHAPGPTIAFSTQATQLPALLDTLRAQGVSFTVVDHALTWSIYFHDESANALEVTCHQYAAATAALATSA